MKISDSKGGYSEGIFKVTYTFDAESKAVHYILQTYQESAKGEAGTKSLLASGIADFNLKYSYRENNEIAWKDDWKKEYKIIPFGVKVSLFYSLQKEAQPVEFSETVLIPTGVVKEVTEGS